MKPVYRIKNNLFELIYDKYDTQANLAKEIQTDPSYLSKILSGKQKVSPRIAYVIAKSLGVSVGDCFYIKNSKRKGS
ncbi:helix-turn-helix transcriptional regulator [Siminovitchia sp. FSL H7-0308]|uniref:Transcriptional regulator with XRE-family HTH domain n=1 Tax=Siminovitchia thermophila TaxID=1245522 RepID=A0ABS2R5H4_9BACI|nr:helix-turn-helix transcriptional regulator [Siminovitchia thermophila]MBM7714650.1 transcriptional regulator with XRE-family HTH domain [Siminovitchia thermophila]ONK22692.1 hypothetical protein BLX87_15090 [Bacillus sp. VT-16-64]